MENLTMRKIKTTLALAGVVLSLASCAATKSFVRSWFPNRSPKAVAAQESTAEGAPAVTDPVGAMPAAATDDGIRLPDMLGLPAEGDFRSTRPAGQPVESGAVISRPPTDAAPR